MLSKISKEKKRKVQQQMNSFKQLTIHRKEWISQKRPIIHCRTTGATKLLLQGKKEEATKRVQRKESLGAREKLIK